MKSKILAVLIFVSREAKLFAVLFSLGALAIAAPVIGQTQLVLYDSFGSSRINPSKWIGLDGDFTSLRDAVRTVVREESDSSAGLLHVFQNFYAFTNSDSGGTGGVFGLGFPNPASVTDLSFTVIVKKMLAVGCATNPSQSGGSAEFRGRFFNTEISPTSQLGDVESVIGPSRNATDAGSQFTVVAFYQRCDDANCGARTTLDFKVLGFVNPGEQSTLHIKWDQPNHRFVYQLNKQAEVVSQYTVSDVSAAVGQGKGIDIAHVVPNCTTTPRPVVTADVYFGNVYTNPQP